MSRPDKAVRFAILGAGLAYAAALYYAGVKLDTGLKQLLALLPTIGAAVLTAWDLLLWRLPALHTLSKRPRLQGLWQVELSPTTDSHIPEGGNRGPIPAFVVISQTYWSIAVRQYTEESKSDSRAFFWQRTGQTEVETLAFLYEDDPQQRHQHRSRRHLGSCSFDPTARTPTEMTGVYFTDRYTKGDMTMTLVDRTTGHASYTAALAHASTARR